jgi:transposase-like protein
MSQPATKKYPAAFKERAVKLAVESDQAIAQTARDLGVNENTSLNLSLFVEDQNGQNIGQILPF